LWISATPVAPGADLAVAIISNSGADLFGGVGATVERWDGNDWQEYGFAGLCVDFWQCAGSVTTDGDQAVNAIGINAGSVMRRSSEGLEPGWYRLSMGLLDNGETPGNRRDIVAAGQFEISPDAPAAGPLWPLEGVHYSLVPALVPPAGGDVFVSPFVPANPDGSLSAEDIAAAVGGQSETARIEQWAHGTWQVAGEVPLTPVTEGNTFDNTATIPPLSAGAYRLVRGGPQGDQMGFFWVTDAVGS
jgi:hypothetical protein